MYDSPKNVSEVKLLSLQKYIAVLIFTIYRRIKRWVKNGFKIYWEIVADDGETWLWKKLELYWERDMGWLSHDLRTW